MPVLFFFLLLTVTFTVAFYLLRPTMTESAVQKRLEDIQESRAEAPAQTILKEEGYSRNAEYSALIRQVPGAASTLDLIRQSGRPWTVASVMGSSLLAALLTAWIASVFLLGVFLS